MHRYLKLRPVIAGSFRKTADGIIALQVGNMVPDFMDDSDVDETKLILQVCSCMDFSAPTVLYLCLD